MTKLREMLSLKEYKQLKLESENRDTQELAKLKIKYILNGPGS